MAEEKTKIIEREYVVPLRKEFLKVTKYRRAGRAAKALKQFIAKHMKVEERDVEKVKVDMYLNNELWFRGKKSPPTKIKVKAKKEEGIVYVTLAEVPEKVKFLKARHERAHKVAEKKPEPKVEEANKVEDKEREKVEGKTAGVASEEKKPEENKAEVEKEKSIEEEKMKESKAEKKATKHVTHVKTPEIQRKALNRH